MARGFISGYEVIGRNVGESSQLDNYQYLLTM